MSRQAGRATGNSGRDCASLEPSGGRQEDTAVSEEQTPTPLLRTPGARDP